MLSHCCNSAMCVQNFNDSLSCAIRITYRSSQRSSSIYEPRDPPFKVVGFLLSWMCRSTKDRFFRLEWLVLVVVEKEGPPYHNNKADPVLGVKFAVDKEWMHVNDPSAGSPTETLLRLLLPLNGKVWVTSLKIVTSEPVSKS